MESTTLFSSESALLLVMFLMVAVGFWLQRFKVFKVLGPALTVIVTGIILSNLKIVPVSSPTYDALSSYCVPLSISICLLSLDLRQMKKLLNRNSIIALASAAVSVCLMAFVFGVLFASKIDEGWKIAGMFVGTYTGGSSNLTAIAVGLDAHFADQISLAELLISFAVVVFFAEPIREALPVNLLLLLLICHGACMGIRQYIKGWRRARGYY